MRLQIPAEASEPEIPAASSLPATQPVELNGLEGAPRDPITQTPLETPENAVRNWLNFFGNEDLLKLWLEVWVQRLVLLFVLLIAAVLLMRLVRRILDSFQSHRRLPEAVLIPIRRALRLLIGILAALVALQIVGVPMTNVFASLGAILALVAIGFVAVWSVLSNISCSFMLLVFKPFRIGDQIELVDSAAGPNVQGRVTDLTLMYVVLREELDDGTVQMVQIPNNLFFQKTIRRKGGRRSIELDDYVDKHGLAGREQSPPTEQ